MNFRKRPKLTPAQVAAREDAKRQQQRIREARALGIAESYRVTHAAHVERQRRAGIAEALIHERFGAITPNGLPDSG